MSTRVGGSVSAWAGRAVAATRIAAKRKEIGSRLMGGTLFRASHAPKGPFGHSGALGGADINEGDDLSGMRSSTEEWRPTREQLLAAREKRVPDVIAPRLRVLFVGINPGLHSAAVRHHFARPGNRFWKALRAGGLTPRVLSPFEEKELLKYGIGVTNIVARATASAAELSRGELRRGARLLVPKVRRYRPDTVAFVGLDAYRVAFEQPRATIGLQPENVIGASVWVLPNPSGINAHYQLPALARCFRELRRALDAD
jgi:double-stranded uracil-DNA glycosylase